MNAEKLDYLNKFILYSDKQCRITISDDENNSKNLNNLNNKFIHWTSYNKEIIKLIDKKVENILNSQSSVLSKQLTLNIKKLNHLQIYMNLLILTICMRYIEIVVKVKRGGFYFSLFSFSFFYFLNKYYEKYRNSELLKVLTNDPNQYLENLKIEQLLKEKESNLTKIKLNKYWKEPMSWH